MLKNLNMKRILPLRFYAGLLRRNMCNVPSGSKNASEGGSMSHKYKPSELQKFILVWTKKYKSKAEVPNYVSLELIEKSRSQARIKLANILMLMTALASLGAILSGKAAAKRGESVHQMNLDWHKQYDEQHNTQQAKESK